MRIIFIESEGMNSKITIGKGTNVNVLDESKNVRKYVKENQVICVNLTKLK